MSLQQHRPYKMSKVKEYPRPHDIKQMFNLSLVTTNAQATIIPIIQQDEALGDPAGYNANKQHASFDEVNHANCYPESTVNNIYSKFVVSLTKHCWNTDKIEDLRIGFMPIRVSFDKDLTVADELTTNTIGNIVEMQQESTDKQAYPIWNTVKLTGDGITFPDEVPGLTTNQNMEGVSFNDQLYYDAKQYYSNAGVLKQVAPNIIWKTVRRRQDVSFQLKTQVPPKTKFMNPYTFYGVMVFLPLLSEYEQLHQSSDDSAGDHVTVKTFSRYNEWNTNFDMSRT